MFELFGNNDTIKRYPNKHPTGTESLPSQTKSKTGTTASKEDVGRELEKTNTVRTSGES